MKLNKFKNFLLFKFLIKNWSFKNLIIILISLFGIYLISNNFKNNFVYLRNYLLDQRKVTFIKKYLFPHIYNKQISREKLNLTKELTSTKEYITKIELDAKKSLIPINFNLQNNDNKSLLKIYSQQNNLISSGIKKTFPGSGFLDEYENNLYLLSSRGIISSAQIREGKNFKFIQIKNNLEEYLNESHFKKGNWFSFKDLLITNDKIYVSFTKEVKSNCWNTSVLEAEIKGNF